MKRRDFFKKFGFGLAGIIAGLFGIKNSNSEINEDYLSSLLKKLGYVKCDVPLFDIDTDTKILLTKPRRFHIVDRVQMKSKEWIGRQIQEKQ